ncbi:MAG: hypothetical protein Q8930_11955, partial [Bacillota bacterium]|nr:hypothetical protein [Bacillota bacterium]
MSSVLQAVKKLLRIGFSSALVIFILLFAIFIVAQGPGSGSVIKNTEGFQNILPFSVNNQSITYKSSDASGSTAAKDVPEGMSAEEREIVINRAKAMAEVKWTPQYDLPEEYCNFVFKKGTTYTGIPYSMGMYQAKNPEDFLNKISGSKVLYGNDCSGYVSAAWGLSRQTTLFFYNAVKNGTDIDGRFVCELPWEELKPA